MNLISDDHILISGGTGFLGGCVVAELLPLELWPRVLLLVRCQTQMKGVERVRSVLRRFEVEDSLLTRVSPEQIICGDLADISTFEADERLERITHVLNCAAVTSFGANPNIWNINVQGTLAFANRIRRLPCLKRFIHVSTAMICGSKPPSLVEEDAYPKADAEHFVDYTESKSRAEMLLREAMGDSPLIIVRPTIIVGHTRLGCKPSGSIFWVFRMFDALGMITGDIDSLMDVLPVDYCARALIHLLSSKTLNHQTYHIAAGPEYSSSKREIYHVFRHALEKSKRRRIYRTVDYSQFVTFQNRFQRIFGPCNKRFILKAIKLYGAFSSLNTTFDNRRLLAEGVPQPPKLTSYFKVCIESCRNISILDQMLVDFQ